MSGVCILGIEFGEDASASVWKTLVFVAEKIVLTDSANGSPNKELFLTRARLDRAPKCDDEHYNFECKVVFDDPKDCECNCEHCVLSRSMALTYEDLLTTIHDGQYKSYIVIVYADIVQTDMQRDRLGSNGSASSRTLTAKGGWSFKVHVVDQDEYPEYEQLEDAFSFDGLNWIQDFFGKILFNGDLYSIETVGSFTGIAIASGHSQKQIVLSTDLITTVSEMVKWFKKSGRLCAEAEVTVGVYQSN